VISFVVPTFNEKGYIGDCLESIEAQSQEKEIIIVDGGSTDGTLKVAKRADKILKDIDGRGKAREKGAELAEGDYIAFIDADTVLKKGYAEKMKMFLESEDLGAASSRFKMTGYRSKLIQAFGNTVFERRRPVVLPGFNTFVRKSVYEESRGFEDILGEDLQFSDEIARHTDTDILEEKLVINSGRRIKKYGLTGTAVYYGIKDIHRRKTNIVQRI